MMEYNSCAMDSISALTQNLQLNPAEESPDSTDESKMKDEDFGKQTSSLETIIEASPYLNTPPVSAQSSQISSCNSSGTVRSQYESGRGEAKSTKRPVLGGWRRRANHQAEDERELAMTKMWYKSAVGKKIPAPAQYYPVYLKNPPALHFSETNYSVRRRRMAQNKTKSMRESVTKRVDRGGESVQPKMNKTTWLRNSFIKKEPVVSTYFESHFDRFQKPPFKIGIRYGL